MLKLFKTILKTGEATLKYPFAPIDICDNFRGKPEYTPEQCIACAACAVACPANALTMNPDAEAGTITWSFFVGRCIFCGRCEEVCPTKAIVLSQEFELAVVNAADMYQHATFKLAKCSVCDEYFAPQKEIEYTKDLLQQAGMTSQAVGAINDLLHTCTDCKRKQNVPGPDKVEFTRYFKESEA